MKGKLRLLASPPKLRRRLLPAPGETRMYIAMNRFKVLKEAQKAFEDMWANRQSRLGEVKGFGSFQLLRGPEREDHVLYASHTVWDSYDDFIAWTKSEQFRDAHKSAGDQKPKTLGHPEFEGFEVIQSSP